MVVIKLLRSSSKMRVYNSLIDH